MSEPPVSPPLPPDAANRLAEFSRVCKAAARAVSLYPGGHPAIGVSLSRLEQTTGRMTESGPYKVQVLNDGLLIDGARMAKPDPAVSELAALLHRHLIGRLTLNAGANSESWRTLLLLLARSPEEVRADGGHRKAVGDGRRSEPRDHRNRLRRSAAREAGPCRHHRLDHRSGDVRADADRRRCRDAGGDRHHRGSGKARADDERAREDGRAKPAGRRAPDGCAPQYRPRARRLRRPHRPAAVERRSSSSSDAGHGISRSRP